MKLPSVRSLSRRKKQIIVVGVALAVLVLGYRLVAHDRVDNPRPDRIGADSADAADAADADAAHAIVVFAGGRGRLVKAQELMDTGAASVLVINHSIDGDGNPLPFDGACTDPSLPYEVICLNALPSTTKGEAIAFSALADDRGWTSLLAVTSDYHLERARFILGNCFSGDVRGDFDPSTYRWVRSERETWELMITWIAGRGC